MRRKIPTPPELLAGVVRFAGDGFVPTESLYLKFAPRSRRDVSTAISRAVREGYLLARRGPDGRRYVALSSEGWAAHREAREDEAAA